jgi:hypothetical protein
VHHRAQLGVFLRMVGGAVPAVYNDFADWGQSRFSSFCCGREQSNFVNNSMEFSTALRATREHETRGDVIVVRTGLRVGGRL